MASSRQGDPQYNPSILRSLLEGLPLPPPYGPSQHGPTAFPPRDPPGFPPHVPTGFSLPGESSVSPVMLPDPSTTPDPLPGPSVSRTPSSHDIYPFTISDYMGRRLIVHMTDGSLICGILRVAHPNGNLLLTEAVQTSCQIPEVILGEVELLFHGGYPMIRVYQHCDTRGLFPLNGDFTVVVSEPESDPAPETA